MSDDRMSLALDLARRAGEVLRAGFGRGGTARHKSPLEVVTEYDLECDRLITEAVRAAYPGDALLAEESGAHGQGEGCWLIDPLDGTTNFAHGIPVFAVSIAYARAGVPELGVIYDPLREELYHAQAGQGAWLNGRRLQVSARAPLDGCLLVTGFPYDIRTARDNNLGHHADLALRSQGVRRLGCASLDLAYVAAGRFDGYWELWVTPWDIGAGVVIVREAGGLVTRADGGPDPLAPPTSVLATNARIHQEMLDVLGLNGRAPAAR